MSLGGPVTRDGARDEARRELSRSIYHEHQPGWFTRLVEWINRKIGDLFDWLSPDPHKGVGGFTGLGVLAGVIVLVVLAVVLRLWLGPVRRTARAARAELDLSSPRSAAELRAEAEELARRGAFAEAVRSRLRAAVRSLEEKTVLDPRPGRTAGELVEEVDRIAGGPTPALAEAVTVFSEIWYGGRAATVGSYQAVVRADEALAELRHTYGRPDAKTFTVPA
jgi:hypothetical protein